MFKIVTIIISTIIFLFLLSFYIDDSIDRRAQHQISLFIDNIDHDLLKRLKSNDVEMDRLLAKAQEHLKSINEIDIWIKNIANTTQKDLNLVHVESGKIVIDHNTFPNLLEPNACQANRGELQKVITFENSFITPPEVLISFTFLDFKDGHDHRLKLKLGDVSNKAFIVDFVTWCDTKMSHAEASWIAVGS